MRVPLSRVRHSLEDTIEVLIVILDILDGDPDFEPGQDAEADPLEADDVPVDRRGTVRRIRRRKRA